MLSNSKGSHDKLEVALTYPLVNLPRFWGSDGSFCLIPVVPMRDTSVPRLWNFVKLYNIEKHTNLKKNKEKTHIRFE